MTQETAADPRAHEEAAIARARSYGVAAIEKLADLMGNEDVRISLAATTALLDRAFGKPGARSAGEEGVEPVGEVRRVVVGIQG